MNNTHNSYIDREKSWLTFNARVLQEANDENVPLLDRFRFLGIFSNNLDEFFRVRYAAIRRMSHENAETEIKSAEIVEVKEEVAVEDVVIESKETEVVAVIDAETTKEQEVTTEEKTEV